MRKADKNDDLRDEILGERLRSSLRESCPRGEPDFAAVYARVDAEGEGRTGRREPGSPRRALHRLASFLPVAAALALAVGLGPSGRNGPGSVSAIVRDELAALAGESVGPAWDFRPGEAASGDPLADELSFFVADLWNQGEGGSD
jgi:hypothetical protein